MSAVSAARTVSAARATLSIRLRRAFTLVELVIVIAIIALATAALLTGLDYMLPSREDAPHTVLRKAVDAAWYRAATGQGSFSLAFDVEKKALIVRPLAAVAALDGTSSAAGDAEANAAGDAGNDSNQNQNSANNTSDDDAGNKPVPVIAGNPVHGLPERDVVQVFAFAATPEVTAVRFARIPYDNEEFGTNDTPHPRLLFAATGGITPAIIEMDIAGETHRYSLDIFGGGLEEIAK